MARAPHHRLRLAAANDREQDGGPRELVVEFARPVLPPAAPVPGRNRTLWIAGGMAACALLAGLTWLTLRASQGSQGPASIRVPLPVARPAFPAQPSPSGPASDAPFDDGLAIPAADLAAPPPQAVLAAAPLPDEPAGAPHPSGPEATRPSHRSPTVVFDAGSEPVTVTPAAVGDGDGADARARIEAAVEDIVERPAKRSRRGGATTLTRGTLIPAVLETAIDSSVPGGVRAIVSSDVRSHDGRRVLIPRSSRLVGQYRASGQGAGKHAEVVWTRLTRPDGLTVGLGGGGLQSVLDASGQPGGQIRVRQGEPVRVYAGRDVELGQ